MSSDVSNFQGKLFGVENKSQFLSNFFVYKCRRLLLVMTCFVDY